MKKLDTPLSLVDEYKVFKEFVLVLRNNYKPTLDKLVGELSEAEIKSLQSLLFIQKLKISKPNKPTKAEYRKLYTIKRLAEYSGLVSANTSKQ